MALAALLWDVDGTLVDSEELHRRAFNEAFAGAGLPWRWEPEEYGRLLKVAGGVERLRHFLRLQGLEEGALGLPVAELHRRKTRRYQELLANGQASLRPGVARLLREAEEQGIRLGIATTTSPGNVRLLQETLLRGVAERWDAVVTGGDVAAKKPAPEVYLLALARLGLGPGEVLAVEDSGIGVEAARRAGLLAVLATQNAYTAADDFCGALAVYDHLGDPELPCRRMAGPPFFEACVRLEHLREWHRRLAERSAPQASGVRLPVMPFPARNQ